MEGDEQASAREGRETMEGRRKGRGVRERRRKKRKGVPFLEAGARLGGRLSFPLSWADWTTVSPWAAIPWGMCSASAPRGQRPTKPKWQDPRE